MSQKVSVKTDINCIKFVYNIIVNGLSTYIIYKYVCILYIGIYIHTYTRM